MNFPKEQQCIIVDQCVSLCRSGFGNSYFLYRIHNTSHSNKVHAGLKTKLDIFMQRNKNTTPLQHTAF